MRMSTWSSSTVWLVSVGVITVYLSFRAQENRPPILLGLMAGFGNLSKVLHRQRTSTAHRLTVPPSGERTVIVIIAIQAHADYKIRSAREAVKPILAAD